MSIKDAKYYISETKEFVSYDGELTLIILVLTTLIFRIREEKIN